MRMIATVMQVPLVQLLYVNTSAFITSMFNSNNGSGNDTDELHNVMEFVQIAKSVENKSKALFEFLVILECYMYVRTFDLTSLLLLVTACITFIVHLRDRKFYENLLIT